MSEEELAGWLERVAQTAPPPRIDDFGSMRLHDPARERMRLAAALIRSLSARLKAMEEALERIDQLLGSAPWHPDVLEAHRIVRARLTLQTGRT